MQDHLPLLDEEGGINYQLMAYSRLFQTEIGNFIKQNKSMHLQYLTSLNLNSDLEVVEDLKKEESAYWEWFVLEILKNEETFRIVHDEIKSKDPRLYIDMHMTRAEDIDVVNAYKKHFLCPSPYTSFSFDDEDADDEQVDDGVTVVDRLAQCYDPQLSLEYLKTHYPSLATTISDPVKHPPRSTSFNYRPYARAILRALPNLKKQDNEIDGYPSMVFHFAKSCRKDAENVPSLVYFMPDYASKIAELEKVWRALTITDRAKEETIEEITEFRDPEEFKEYREEVWGDSSESEMPKRREYQRELAKKANEGENTVIVAPTGSGKTVVAADIIRQHIERRGDMGKGARVVIVAPTVPLVAQHAQVLYRYLRDVAYIDYMHGDFALSQNVRIKSLLSNNVIICTPQLLINCLQSVRSEERLFVADFSLLILDECHHTCEKHPYAQLMTMVRKAKGDLPQVVGMTASLGIGKQGLREVENGVNHVKSLLARMGATSISRVVKHAEELAAHVHRPTDHIDEVGRALLSKCPFTQKIIEFMSEIREFLKGELVPLTKYDAEFSLPKSLVHSLVTFPLTEERCGSRARLMGILNDIKCRLNRMRSGPERVKMVDAIDMMLLYIRTLDMNDLLPAANALVHMCMEVAEKMKTRTTNTYLNEFTEKKRELKALEGTEKEKMMLTKLREEVLAMNESSRCIVFVETREVCKHLSEYIQGFLAKGKKCGFVMSSKSHGSSLINQTHTEQSDTLRDFRNGQISVMVATTVANEGIDVPQCNLIIKYNMTGNVISKVQQEGRARAKDSKSILIVLTESVLERERENLAAQVRMKNILERLYREGEGRLAMDIQGILKEMEETTKKEEEEAKRLEEDLAMNRYDLLCRHCLEVICPSHSIKVDPFSSTYYSTDPAIWDKVVIQIPVKLKSQNISSDCFAMADISCRRCADDGSKHVIGKLYRRSSCYLPSLRLNEMRLRNSDTMRNEDEWKGGWDALGKTLFYISKIHEELMSKTLAALKEKDIIKFNRLEVRCEEIVRRMNKREKPTLTVDKGWDDE